MGGGVRDSCYVFLGTISGVAPAGNPNCCSSHLANAPRGRGNNVVADADAEATPRSHGREGGKAGLPPSVVTATVISERRRRWLVCPPYPDGISHGQKKRQDGKAVFLSPACLNSAGNGSSFFYFSNGGDVVVRSPFHSMESITRSSGRWSP